MTDRIGPRSLEQLQGRLSERDFAILKSIREHRFLTTKQIIRLHFTHHATILAGTRACVRVLTRLREHRLVTRLDRQVGGVRAGSGSYIWCLDAVGDRITREEDAYMRDRRRRFFEPSTIYLAHTLAVAEARVAIEEEARTGNFELIDVETEPASWRPYLGRGGNTEILKPDLTVVTAAAGWEAHWFIEVDRGTESIPVLLAKCRQYERYRQTGHEQAVRGLFPYVLWVLPHQGRRAQLEAAIAQTGELSPALFRIIDAADIAKTVDPGRADPEIDTDTALDLGAGFDTASAI